MQSRLLIPAIALTLITGGPAVSLAQEQKPMKLDREIKTRAQINYLLALPEGYTKNKDKWPVILFLHGAGESGDDLEKVKVHGPPKLIAAGQKIPAIVISPQAPSSRVGHNPQVLAALLDEIEQKYRVDKDRIYVTGLSMGGFGTWALASAYPERFAAIAPICGGGDAFAARRLSKVPMWVFHGAKDTTVPLDRSTSMVEAVKAAGGNPIFTVYPTAGHDSWTDTYNNPEFFKWLFEQKRGL
jgi:predicted peptidase